MAKQIREWLSDVTGVQLPDIGLGPGGVKDIKPPKVTTPAPGQIGVTFGEKTYATQQSTHVGCPCRLGRLAHFLGGA